MHFSIDLLVYATAGFYLTAGAMALALPKRMTARAATTPARQGLRSDENLGPFVPVKPQKAGVAS
jgi:hypothetical protein